MKNYRNVALSALLGVVSFASLAAYDSYSQQGNWTRGQDGSYYQQDGNQAYQDQASYGYYADNQGKMDSSSDTSDEAVATRVLSALQNDSSLSSPQDVHVSADKGKVTLIGTVTSEAEKSRVEAVAKKVKGVKSVSNNVTVAK